MNETARHIANIVLWHCDSRTGLYPPGSFEEKLIAAIFYGDPENQSRLAQGFPFHVEAVQLVQLDLNGLDHLRNLVRTA